MAKRAGLTNPWPERNNLSNTETASMLLQRALRLTRTQESIHALVVIIHNLDRGLSLYPIAIISHLMPYWLLTRDG